MKSIHHALLLISNGATIQPTWPGSLDRTEHRLFWWVSRKGVHEPIASYTTILSRVRRNSKFSLFFLLMTKYCACMLLNDMPTKQVISSSVWYHARLVDYPTIENNMEAPQSKETQFIQKIENNVLKVKVTENFKFHCSSKSWHNPIRMWWEIINMERFWQGLR